MLPPQTSLEVRSVLPQRDLSKPPLLFIHGGYCDAWCWTPYFLPWFAAHGYAAYALSLRGHGQSGGRDSLFVAGLDDYAADVEYIASTLPTPPILIGHSMGAAVIERLLATHPVRAAALLAPIPPTGLGPVAGRLLSFQPEYLVNMQRLDAPHLAGDVMASLLPLYFSADVAPDILAEARSHITVESPRALLDLTLRLHGGRPAMKVRPFILGAESDRIATPDDVRATATLYDVSPMMVPGLAHMLMLEPAWLTVAEPLLHWLEGDLARGPAANDARR